MITFETPLKKLKYEVLKNVAELVINDELNETKIEEIPFQIIEGTKAKYRCCVYKERAIVKERAKLAMGYLPNGDEEGFEKVKDESQIIYVIESACDRCPINRFTVTEACRGCIQHKCMEVCPANAITRVNGRAYINQELCRECGMCKKACPYNAISDVMRPCKRACPTGALEMDTETKITRIDESNCINCGACMSACPFGAISDVSYIVPVINSLKDKHKKVYAVVAPAITGQFGNNVTVGMVKDAIKRLGFEDMYEAACGADAVSVHEAEEFAERIENGDKYMVNSCCSALVSYIEKKFPSEVSKISGTVSPMVATARMIKKEDKDAVVVFIGPCTAKKAEIKRDEIKDAVEYALTFEELAALLGAFKIDIDKCQDIEVDDASKYGRNFAQSGGLTAAVQNYISDKNIDVDFKPYKVSGGDDIKKAMTLAKVGRLPGNFIEGMMCDNGCIGGAGTMIGSLKTKGQLIKFSNNSNKKTILSNDNLDRFKDVKMDRE